ncbi:hypothetical protein [Roseimaritima multifibrata]|uniref:hypothetical protein n=1 Tax=Roseimaritima multifibrata TaxID=1930274 RepID=UPI001C54CD6D|nr:hypothetical protein [Roseimaritima multifibrata]
MNNAIAVAFLRFGRFRNQPIRKFVAASNPNFYRAYQNGLLFDGPVPRSPLDDADKGMRWLPYFLVAMLSCSHVFSPKRRENIARLFFRDPSVISRYNSISAFDR